MEQADGTDHPSSPTLWQDPRLYQIASLSALLLYGFFFLHFDISIWQIIITLSVAQLTQYTGARYSLTT